MGGGKDGRLSSKTALAATQMLHMGHVCTGWGGVEHRFWDRRVTHGSQKANVGSPEERVYFRKLHVYISELHVHISELHVHISELHVHISELRMHFTKRHV